MNEYSEEIDRGANSGFKAAMSGDARPPSGGTFSLRRARYFSDSGTPLLAPDIRGSAVNLVNEIDAETQRKMVALNLRMVVNIAARYANRGLDLVELVRIGNQGFISAMEAYEPESILCFSAFVTSCVSQKIELALKSVNTGRKTTLSTSTPNEVVPLQPTKWMSRPPVCSKVPV